ncbi:ocellar opsin-like [Paramacrobiotus metropolitanus]|uniref:ocellar opsin-like n=1 Tax=Paramacrobiotus metropolitanus TaxID=2943436 RepID=UPI002445D9D1|nr:ocellar opsin-like [Paramacrobiotus metropolitanus]
MEPLIHEHWKHFPPVSYLWHLALAIIVLLLGVISISGNAAVAYIFTQTKGLRNPSNALIVNLAISDFGMMITNCPMYFMSSLKGKWIFGVQACRFYGFTGGIFGCASILTMTAIAVDRYLVICKPFLIMKSAMTRERAKLAVACVWIYSAIWASLPLTGISDYVLEGFLTTCTIDYMNQAAASRTLIFCFFMGAYVAPLTTIVVCYSLITLEVYRHAKKFKHAANRTAASKGAKANEEEIKKKKELKTAKIAGMIIALWVFAWTPYATVALIGIATNGSLLTPIVSQLPALFCKTAAVYNPIVYAISHPKYRAALRHKFPFLICIREADDEERSTSGQRGASSSTMSKSRSDLRKQISTTSQTGSVDSELSNVDAPDTVATPQGGRRRSSKRSRVAPAPAQPEVVLTALPSAAEAQQATVVREMVATYSKSEQPTVAFIRTSSGRNPPQSGTY